MSLTIKAFLSLVIVSLLRWAGFEALEGDVANFLLIAWQLVSAVLVWYGRYRQGDITWYGKKA